MPITIKEIEEHKDYFGLHHLDTMTKEEYQQTLESDAFFWVDHHGFLRHYFSGEILATNKEQSNLLIAHLKKLNDAFM